MVAEAEPVVVDQAEGAAGPLPALTEMSILPVRVELPVHSARVETVRPDA